jgi:hypothetical protein
MFNGTPVMPLPVRPAGHPAQPAARALLLAAALTAACPVAAAVWLNEFVADNDGSHLTAAGEASDWIELYNDGPDAVDLGGWHLTDNANNPTKWRFPDSVSIAPDGYLVLFADSSPVSVTNGELHANFSLSKDGEYLGLVDPDGATVADAFAPLFPPQYEGVSYGRAFRTRELLEERTPARYRVPDAAGTAPWRPAAGALGFSASAGLFNVRYYEMNAAIPNVGTAQTMVDDSGYWKTDRVYPVTGQYPVINFHGTSASGNFADDTAFPGHTGIGQDKNYFVVVAEGPVHIPSAGTWTFAVGSDDGFRLRLSGHGVDFVAEFATGRSFGTTLADFNFPAAGTYDLSLLYYENTGGASVELSAAQGFQSAFSADRFVLVGDPGGGLRHASVIGTYIETDVAEAMRGVNARLDAEWPFAVDETPEPGDAAVLAVRAVDGYAAAVNGAPVAAFNVPAPLAWDSAATAARPAEEALAWLETEFPVAQLVPGSNTLAVTALNDAAADTEFLIQPRLFLRSAGRHPFFFKTPTPGAANAQPYTPPTPAVTAGEPRGYKLVPFTVTLTCEDPAAVIRYTLDGSIPSSTNGAVYAAPLLISQTTTLRAAAVDDTSLRQQTATFTWLFLSDVIRQGAATPTGWPTNQQANNHVMEYGMRQDVVDGDTARLCDGMTNAIPSLSLVTDLSNLFDPQNGIYVNPRNDGRTWERPVSVELIDPVNGGTAEFHIDAGLRIRGAASRSETNPKHALRLFFRSEYGEGKLRFPLFGDEGAAEFDKVDLRCSQNYSWAFADSSAETFIREVFSRDIQRDMGMPYTRSRYYHLYLNGQYWGLYQTQERGDADFAETYLGGDKDDWDCIKTSNPGYTTTASDGTFDAFHALHNLAVNQGFAGAYSNNYWRVRGLDPDGTPNPAYPAYLDQDNLIVYMLSAYYTGDPDSPISAWGGFPNNMYGLFNRAAPGGFKWLRHDAEHSLGAHGGYPVTWDPTYLGTSLTSQAHFNPTTLHLRLCEHPEYRTRFADLAYRHLSGDGALTPANAQARFRSRMDEIDLAVVAESARWGRGKTRDAHWLPACNAVLYSYLNQRRDILVNHLRARGWYPALDAPRFSTNNAAVPHGHTLTVSATNDFYYTTDGSDPRLSGGGINPAAVKAQNVISVIFDPPRLIPTNAVWRYFDAGAEPAAVDGLSWKDPDYPDTAWASGPATLGFAGTATANPVSTVTRRYVNGVSGTQVTTTYFRHTFAYFGTPDDAAMRIDILRDDGAVVYLNGNEILRENMPAGAISYATWSSAVVGSPDQNTTFSRTVDAARFLLQGDNVLAVELHQCNAGSSDLYFSLALILAEEFPDPVTDLATLTVTNDLTVLARAYVGGEWGPLARADLALLREPVDYSKLRVTELMYAPPAPGGGSPYANDDFAWLELRNTGATALDLAGVGFTSGITHTFASLDLAPGARLVLAKNPAAFATRHAAHALTLVAWTSGNLARRGETLALTAPGGANILTFTYSDTWYPETFNTGRSLVVVDPAAAEPLWSAAANWRPSRASSGSSPGFPDTPLFTAANLDAGASELRLSVEGMESTVAVWYSDDLSAWHPCPAAAWSRDGDLITVDLLHPQFPPSSRRFFQIRLAD